jgi:hypothetical protein
MAGADVEFYNLIVKVTHVAEMAYTGLVETWKGLEKEFELRKD